MSQPTSCHVPPATSSSYSAARRGPTTMDRLTPSIGRKVKQGWKLGPVPLGARNNSFKTHHTFNCPPSIKSGHTPLVLIGLHVICSGAATSISREDSIEPIQLLQWHQNSPRTQHRQHPPPQHFPVDPGNILKAKGVPQFPYPPTHRGSNHRNGRLTVWGTPFFLPLRYSFLRQARRAEASSRY
jgi:hypothetical protein